MTTKNKKDIASKTLRLSFELTNYLINKPSEAEKLMTDNIVLYTQDDLLLNNKSDEIAYNLIKRGKDIIKATRLNGSLNRWHFENLNYSG